ncbi:M28 family peptidase [Solwaraspora sp. WMMD937]|uniref:M20/M25/M40 family metallo-hydrolase n=1 Tax=Solwaraspora sp. WMMD937 TaxID=3016090 RepID=UPI00249A451B|nr:M20/M25/M40 family metallo-hydrolase [Solwaraspora sp. WMMD937]WFE20056.1 M28 family peptidase [Solwaraspora sp. WMMD937]
MRKLRAAIDDDALGRVLRALPAPRVRTLTPDVCAGLDIELRNRFAAVGWTARLDHFHARGVAQWGPSGRYEDVLTGTDIDGVNIVAVKEGELSEAVLVLAHHDTVPGTGGADDNGTGMVGLLELARLLGAARFRRTVLLVAVDHEELGFHGARHLVRQMLVGRRKVVGAYVFEMLGFISTEPGSQHLPRGLNLLYPGQIRRIRRNGQRADFAAVLYQRSSRTMAALFAAALTQLNGPTGAVLLRAPTDLPVLGPLLNRFVPFTQHFARSDHLPFWDAGLPAVQITDTANFRNPHYHRPGDVPDTVSMTQVADVVAATALAVEILAERLG